MNEKIETTLRKRGYRMTPQREMITETLFRTTQHLTAEQIYEELRMRTRALNIATVYRTLDLLVDEGLASRVDLGEDRIYFAASQHGSHIHLVCRGCGSVSESDHSLLEPLGKMLRRKYGFYADLGHLSITGLCRECQASAQAD